jgi:hypothetical protein
MSRLGCGLSPAIVGQLLLWRITVGVWQFITRDDRE